MIIGIPKEIKPQEYRVAITPAGVQRLHQEGHTILVQTGAGIGSGFSDQQFRNSGAKIISLAKEIWKKSDLILKVKEPLPKEYPYFRPGLILFTFLHLANQPRLITALKKSRITAIGYETISDDQNHLPLLKPMSEIAGKLAVLIGAEYLRTDRGKKGILLSHVEGTRPGKVTILGGGNVGRAALEVAIGIGAEVVLVDSNSAKLEEMKKKYPKNLSTIFSDNTSIESVLPETDLLIGAVLIPGAKAPKLVSRKMVSQMQAGSVIIDVSVDQGGCIETTRPTTHAKPVFIYKNIIHYGVTNIPSLAAKSATEALSYQTLPYLLRLASEGIDALKDDKNFRKGLQIDNGKITYSEIQK